MQLTRARLTRLSNGMRVASAWSPSKYPTLGLWVRAGSRYQRDHQHGVAHFLEHMLFMGTARFEYEKMFKKIESIGANFNAQTDRELCGYYIDCFAKDRAFAVDLLADCALNSLLEEQHIEYQKQVVLDEKEHCSLQVWFALKENINLNSFPGQSIASTMLGSIRDIKRIKRDTLREYLDENYVGNTMCFVGTGDIRHEEIESLVSKSFAKVPSKEAKNASKPVFHASDCRKRDSDTDLCFFMFGFPFHGLQDPNVYTLSLLSKLYQLLSSATGQYNGTWFKNLSKIKSLSRNFGSSVTLDSTENGFFTVYAATDASKAEQVSLLIADSINQMSQLSGIENDIFRIAKEHLLYDYLKEFSTSRRANRMIGTQVLTLDRIVHPFEIQQRIQAISLQDIQIAAELYLFNAPFAFSALGRVENLPKYDTLRAKMCSPIQQQT